MVKYLILIISLFSFGFIFCGEKSFNSRILKDGRLVSIDEYVATVLQLNKLSPMEQEALFKKCISSKDILPEQEQKTCSIFIDGQH